MRILYLDCGMGAAGDMLGAALYELLDDERKQQYIEEINSAGIEGVRVEAKPDVKVGIAGTHMSVLIDGEEEYTHHDHDSHEHEHSEHKHDHENFEHTHSDTASDSAHEHDADRDHESLAHHHHHHASLADVHDIINHTSFSDKVKEDAVAVYDLIAAAESRAHKMDVGEIHFHEVGMKDAIVDVLGVCRLMELIAPDRVCASPIRVGFGEVRCAHGIMPVPAPATAYLLEDIPVYAGDIHGEMCTPTGAALLKYFVSEYINMPCVSIERTGYGCGSRDFERANCVRSILGMHVDIRGHVSAMDAADAHSVGGKHESADNGKATGVVELSTNIDDMTGEAMSFAAEVMRDAGALDVFVTPIYMKKNRPGYMLTVLCGTEDEESMTALFFKHTSTWGIRRRDVERSYMETRIEKRDTPYGEVRFKVGEGFGVTKSKPEYEDIARIAAERSLSIAEVIGNIPS